MSITAPSQTTPQWTAENDAAGDKEGWGIYDCGTEWQVQRVDCPEEGEALADDQDAWAIVFSGTAAHHQAAREFIQHHNPQEWAAICEKFGGVAASADSNL